MADYLNNNLLNNEMNNLAASKRGINFIYNTVFRSKLRVKPTSVGFKKINNEHI